MNVRLVPCGNSLIAETAGLLHATEKDYSGNMVVYPGRRPSHYLRKHLADQIKGPFIPPVIFSMDDFVNHICEESGQGRVLDAIDAVAILYGIHKNTSRPMGKNGFLSADSFFPLGMKIFRDIEELLIEGIRGNRIKSIDLYADESVPEGALNRLQSLSFFFDEFYKQAGEMGRSTRAMRYKFASENLKTTSLGEYRRIIIAGFFALTAVEKEIFSGLARNEHSVFIFQDGPGIRDTLTGLGVSIDENLLPLPEPQVHLYRCPDTHGQVFSLAKVLEDQETRPDERSVIVLPSPEPLFPLLRQTLSGYDQESFNISMGYPLLRTPIFGFLNVLMELIASKDGDRLYIPDYLKYALHPYTKNIFFKGTTEVTRIMFHTIEEHLISQRARMFITLSEIEDNPGLFSEIIEKTASEGSTAAKEELSGHLKSVHDHTVRRFMDFRNIGEFASCCSDLLIYIFENSTAGSHPFFHPFAESFIIELDIIARSLMKDMRFDDRNSYFTFFRRYFSACHTPFEGTPIRGLQVLGFLETRNLKFDNVYILDVNEEVLPDTAKEESLLPLRAREMLGLPTYRDKDRLSLYYFETLFLGANAVHLFFVEDDKKERSRFIEQLLWKNQQKDREVMADPYFNTVEYRINLKNIPPTEITKGDEIAAFLSDFTYSASALNSYLACQLRFYYSHVLGLGKRQEATGDVEKIDIGILVHDALSEFFRGRIGRRLAEKDLDPDEMERISENTLARVYGPDPAGPVYLLSRQVTRRLRSLVTDYYLPLAKEISYQVNAVEEKIDIVRDGFKLTGRLDIVEKRAGKTVIADFKTSSNPDYLIVDFEKLDLSDRRTWERGLRSLQLPFYTMLYAGRHKIKAEQIESMFLLIGRTMVDNKMEIPLYQGIDPEQAYPVLESIIMRLVAEIVDPAVPFIPASDMKKTCPQCDFRYICGTQWVG